MHLGPIGLHVLVYLTYAFLLGAAAHVLRDCIEMRARTAVIAGGVVLATTVLGGFFLVGLPAFVYLLLWTASTLPPVTHRVGVQHDYSYGLYVYGWPVQMVVSAAGGAALGLPGFILVSLATTFVLAVPSWRLIESRALTLRPRQLHDSDGRNSDEGDLEPRPSAVLRCASSC